MEVFAREGQMISFGGKYNEHHGLTHYFGNPVDMNKVIEWILARLKKGLVCDVKITGRPYKAFYTELNRLKRERRIFSVRTICKRCKGSGYITKPSPSYRHYSGVKVMAMPGLVFNIQHSCPECERYGYREYLMRGHTQ